MKHPDHRPPLFLLFAGLLPGLVACSHAGGGYTHSIETYHETEVNDIAPLADYFGVLRPGDHFYIEGRITDIPYDPYYPWNGYDPFDGFAFTADRPIHVEFRLFIEDYYSDLDVLVYDPQIDADVGWFQTDHNPETGAVDVFAGGLDFHLVIESWVGISNYSLEIEVYDLYPSSVDGNEPDGIAPGVNEAAGGIVAARLVDPLRAESAPAADAPRYGGQQEEALTPEVKLEETTIDPETGDRIESSHAMDADG